MKHHYNKHHISLLLNSDDLVMLKLHHKYHVSDVKNKKLSIQQVEHFSIKQQVFSLVYELDLSSNMKIHSVISVTNLKSLSSDKDLYKCQYNKHLSLIKKNKVKKNNLDKEWKSFYIEKLLNQHLHHYRCDKKIIKYLIKWTEYRSEFNEWYDENLLDSTVKFMLEYKIHQNSDLKQIKYLCKLLADKEKTAATLQAQHSE